MTVADVPLAEHGNFFDTEISLANRTAAGTFFSLSREPFSLFLVNLFLSFS